SRQSVFLCAQRHPLYILSRPTRLSPALTHIHTHTHTHTHKQGHTHRHTHTHTHTLTHMHTDTYTRTHTLTHTHTHTHMKKLGKAEVASHVSDSLSQILIQSSFIGLAFH